MQNPIEHGNQDVIAMYKSLTSTQSYRTPYTPFEEAICLVRMGNFSDAQEKFRIATTGLLNASHYWMTTGEPNIVAEAYILSGERDPVPASLLDALRIYSASPKGNSLVAQYAMATISLLVPGYSETEKHVARLLSIKNVRWTYAIGLVLSALLQNEPLMSPLSALIEAYRNYGKREFRWDARRLLCTPAMCLASLRLDQIDSPGEDSFSLDYLRYISTPH